LGLKNEMVMPVKLSAIKPNDKNPRTIRDARFERLKTSLEEFPAMMELRPIITDAEGTILGGNMRYRALKALGYKELPDGWVKRADELTEEEKRRFIIADNVGFGDWDWDTLGNEWDSEELAAWGLEVPGWDAGEEIPEAEEDDYEMPDVIHTDIVLGDLFEIGPHRLLCGDSTDSDAVGRLMNGEQADMVFTDPPYDIEFEYSNAALFCPDGHIFVFNNDRAIVSQLHKSPFKLKGFFVFHHGGTAIPQEGGHEVFLDHVLISHEVAGRPKVRYNKGDGTRTVLKGEYRRAEEHKHQKPFSVLAPIVKGYTDTGLIVLDFFAGGGSLFSVCHQLNRRCYGMELDPKYCQVIIDRMLKLDPALEVKRNGEAWQPKPQQHGTT
jgi:DNA modification methylase